MSHSVDDVDHAPVPRSERPTDPDLGGLKRSTLLPPEEATVGLVLFELRAMRREFDAANTGITDIRKTLAHLTDEVMALAVRVSDHRESLMSLWDVVHSFGVTASHLLAIKATDGSDVVDLKVGLLVAVKALTQHKPSRLEIKKPLKKRLKEL